MLAALNNVTTQDQYADATTLLCEGAVKINMQVNNAAIYYQYVPRTSLHPAPGNLARFGPEAFKGPGERLMSKNADAIRVRSAVVGVPAQVSIEALGPGE